jgi:hypothetical protein
MRKISLILGIVAIAASTLFVSCAKKHVPNEVPAFPRKMSATYQLNSKGVHAWGSYVFADDGKTSCAWGSTNRHTGCRVDPQDATRLMMYFAPNKDWSVRITESAREFLEFRVQKVGDPLFDDNSYYSAYETSGKRNNQAYVTIVVTKLPEAGEEPFVGELEISMANQTMPLATITVGPQAEESDGE